MLEVPTDTKFSYDITLGGRRVGGATVEMPDWKYPPESSRAARGRSTASTCRCIFRSYVFENDRTGWIYVPAAYDGTEPAALMVFQDGDAYRREHVGTVVDNLIADGDMPVTILVLLNPGVNDDGSSQPERRVRHPQRPLREVPRRRGAAADRRRNTTSATSRPAGPSAAPPPAASAPSPSPGSAPTCSAASARTSAASPTSAAAAPIPSSIRESDRKPIRVVLHDGTQRPDQSASATGGRRTTGWPPPCGRRDTTSHFVTDDSFHAFHSAGRVLPETLRLTWAGWHD